MSLDQMNGDPHVLEYCFRSVHLPLCVKENLTLSVPFAVHKLELIPVFKQYSDDINIDHFVTLTLTPR